MLFDIVLRIQYKDASGRRRVMDVRHHKTLFEQSEPNLIWGQNFLAQIMMICVSWTQFPCVRWESEVFRRSENSFVIPIVFTIRKKDSRVRLRLNPRLRWITRRNSSREQKKSNFRWFFVNRICWNWDSRNTFALIAEELNLRSKHATTQSRPKSKSRTRELVKVFTLLFHKCFLTNSAISTRKTPEHTRNHCSPCGTYAKELESLRTLQRKRNKEPRKTPEPQVITFWILWFSKIWMDFTYRNPNMWWHRITREATHQTTGLD